MRSPRFSAHRKPYPKIDEDYYEKPTDIPEHCRRARAHRLSDRARALSAERRADSWRDYDFEPGQRDLLRWHEQLLNGFEHRYGDCVERFWFGDYARRRQQPDRRCRTNSRAF